MAKAPEVQDIIDDFNQIVNDTKGLSFQINIMNLMRNDSDLIAFTGVTFHLLVSLTKAISLCEKENYKNIFSNNLQDRIALILCKLYLNLPFKYLSVLFGMSRQSAAHLM